MVDTPDTPACARLKEADAAWHALNIGANVRAVTDENGERIEFNSSTRQGLLTYIRTLQPQCLTYTALALGADSTRGTKFLF